MFFWIATICNLVYYLIIGVTSVVFGSFISELDTLAEFAEVGTALILGGVLELVFVVACITLMVMGVRKTPNTIRFWLLTLAVITMYELVQSLLLVGTGAPPTDFIWPVVAMYFFARGLMSAKRLRATIEASNIGDSHVA